MPAFFDHTTILYYLSVMSSSETVTTLHRVLPLSLNLLQAVHHLKYRKWHQKTRDPLIIHAIITTVAVIAWWVPLFTNVDFLISSPQQQATQQRVALFLPQKPVTDD